MSDVPFSQLLAQRANANASSDRRSKKIKKEEAVVEKNPREHKKRTTKKKDNEPAVLSTRVPMSRKRMVVAVAPKRQVRDPRFDSLSGSLDQQSFEKAYGFVDEYRGEELKELQDLLRETVDQDEREEIVARIKMLKHQDRVLNQKKERFELSVRVKAKKRKINEEAGRPMKLNKKKVKEIEMEERYKMLEENKKLDKYMGKKRKKLEQRNKKLIPTAHAK